MPSETRQVTRQSPPFQFGLSSLLLITTLAAVVMSVSVMVPGVGIALAVLATPALIRTYVLVRRSRAGDKPATMNEKVLLFMACLAIATLIAMATGAAFFAACFLGFWGGSAAAGGGMDSVAVGLITGPILGLLAGLPVLTVLMVKWFRRPVKSPPITLDLMSTTAEPPPGAGP